MHGTITLRTSDGHRLSAYENSSKNARIGVVVLQEIFGVNVHIRDVIDRLALEGYAAIAPAIFDRIEPGHESGYSESEINACRTFIDQFDWDAAIFDITAAIDHLRAKGLEVAVIGFCLGGSLAFLAATRLDCIRAVVGYYGGAIAGFANEVPRCPTMLHYGEHDHTISMDNIAAVRTTRPEVAVHVYNAGHGFNCDARKSWDAKSAKLAWERTMTHINHHTLSGLPIDGKIA